jgi:hypothetical protein
VPAFAAVGAGFAITMSGSGTDTKNADLLAYFGTVREAFHLRHTNITAEDCVSGAGNGFSAESFTAAVEAIYGTPAYAGAGDAHPVRPRPSRCGHRGAPPPYRPSK